MVAERLGLNYDKVGTKLVPIGCDRRALYCRRKS